MSREETAEPKVTAHAGASVPWQYGWRLYVVLFTLFSGLFLSTLETTIIATALVSISSQLGDFQKVNWIPVACLITVSCSVADLKAEWTDRTLVHRLSGHFCKTERYIWAQTDVDFQCFPLLDLLSCLWRCTEHDSAVSHSIVIMATS